MPVVGRNAEVVLVVASYYYLVGLRLENSLKI
jgi:hypothetical protein